MKDTLGLILTNEGNISPITEIRAVAALPVAGSYRMIDFLLSAMKNAGIYNVGVVTKSKYMSLIDHVRSGKPWDLARKKKGLQILPPNLDKGSYGKSSGNIDLLRGIKDYLRKSDETYVVLAMGNYVCNLDLADIIEKHIESQADVTVVYKDLSDFTEKELSRFTLIEVDKDERVTDIEVMPNYPKSNLAGLDVYVMEKALLESIIDECSARGEHDFIKDALAKKISGLYIHGYKTNVFCDKIDTLKAYYECNMKFLNKEVRDELFHSKFPIYTKTKDRAPSRYASDAVVSNSIISDGCMIEGRVENSVLSRGVTVKKGAVVKNCIIMQGSVIDENVTLENVVFDKEVHITKGKRLIGQENYPLAVEKGVII